MFGIADKIHTEKLKLILCNMMDDILFKTVNDAVMQVLQFVSGLQWASILEPLTAKVIITLGLILILLQLLPKYYNWWHSYK